jgi:hypothetical protein
MALFAEIWPKAEKLKLCKLEQQFASFDGFLSITPRDDDTRFHQTFVVTFESEELGLVAERALHNKEFPVGHKLAVRQERDKGKNNFV